MFRVESTPHMPPLERSGKWVVDHERDVSLELVGSNTREAWRESFKLIWQGWVVPLAIIRTEGRDKVTGATYVRTQFERYSVASDFGSNVTFHRFTNDAERHQAMLLAVEALLAFGSHYDGDKRPDGFHRIEFEGKLYRKSDFGMT